MLPSLVEATAHNSGQTYLHRLCNHLHSIKGLPPSLSPSFFYFTCTELEQEDWLDLDWWLEALTRGLRRQARSLHLERPPRHHLGRRQWHLLSGGGSMTMEAWMGIWNKSSISLRTGRSCKPCSMRLSESDILIVSEAVPRPISPTTWPRTISPTAVAPAPPSYTSFSGDSRVLN